ncbi:MAG: flagellar basal body L-ring protein FlgH [Candidatus Margulisbacteria bacterium]|nr:flagellar basal body L-ring protein FlgH [Candidatus Margulisiibacteriota bacterium]
MGQTILKYLLVSIAIFVLPLSVFGDSLWEAKETSLYTRGKAPKKSGDTVTILISESSRAVHEASTRTSKESGIGANFLDYWDQFSADTLGDQNNRKNQRYLIDARDRYTGLGQTSRKSDLKAVVTAVVVEVFPNGNLYVVGENNVKVNEEVETIRVSGIVDPSRLSASGTVYSNQMANVEISFKGKGSVGSKQSPGLLTKIFGWVF